MSPPDLNRDDALAALVGEMLGAADPVPTAALTAAYEVIGLRGLEAELAELVYDSRDRSGPVAVRGGQDETRLLSFANDRLALDAELLGDGRTIVGQLSPPGAAVVEISRGDAVAEAVEVDEFGGFRALLGEGPVRFRVPGQLVTPWITR